MAPRPTLLRDPLEPMLFDAYDLARAWLAVAIAQGTDDNLPALCRTTLVEWYPTGIRLVSTDAFVLLRAWVPAGGAYTGDRASEPRLTSQPTAVTVVRDLDRRALGLFGYLRTATKGQPEGKADPIDVVLSTDRRGDDQQPTLDPSLAALHFTIEVPGSERLRLDTFDGTFPTWRPLFTDHSPQPADQLIVTPLAVLRLGQLAKVYGDNALRFTLAGDHGPILVAVEHPDINVRGIAMPGRSKRDDTDALAAEIADELHGDRLVDPDTGEILPKTIVVDFDPADTAERTGRRVRRRKEPTT